MRLTDICTIDAPCRELVQKPDLVRGRAVLELGSGCGLCGIVADQLGAQQVGR